MKSSIECSSGKGRPAQKQSRTTIFWATISCFPGKWGKISCELLHQLCGYTSTPLPFLLRRYRVIWKRSRHPKCPKTTADTDCQNTQHIIKHNKYNAVNCCTSHFAVWVPELPKVAGFEGPRDPSPFREPATLWVSKWPNPRIRRMPAHPQSLSMGQSAWHTHGEPRRVMAFSGISPTGNGHYRVNTHKWSPTTSGLCHRIEINYDCSVNQGKVPLSSKKYKEL